MVPWKQAYERIRTSEEWVTRFGKMYRMDEFRFYAYALKFASLLPAQLATGATTPNTGSAAATRAGYAAPTVNIVPGPASDLLIDFPAGAVILGITAAAVKLQRIANNGGAIAFTYGPTNHKACLDLFLLDLEYVDGDPITGGNPIPDVSANANSAINAAPPIDADALLGRGGDTETPARELYVTPGLGIRASARSMVLPDTAPATGQPNGNLAVHLVFHCMVPGEVRMRSAA